MYNWEGVAEFVTVAETESFTAAAKKLSISTAHVSRQVSALESRLATKLLHRTTRKVSVTEAGTIYYQRCRQLLDGLENAEHAISDLQTKPTGRLRITAPVTYGEITIAPLINNFLARYPELKLELQLSNRKMDLIDEGYDLGIRQGQLEDSTMMAKRLASRTLYVCAAPAYLAEFGEPHKLSDLNHHNCLQGSADHWHFQDEGKTRNINISGNLRCNSGRALVDAALKGLGIVQLPGDYALSYIRSGQLMPLLEKYCAPDEGVWAIYPHNRHLLPKVRMLIDYLDEELSGHSALAH
ncbi:LysR substrate-binding domain-containing protein [Marinobacter sp. M3C]|uniref:LysR substrate-binding domain-containing protein n=1 Tax=unclassified Marinobacter TaxID=83889 RepID=UPI00200C73F3|nr:MULTISPECIES: LysR substrate-binding domain-containing protein [unclassified Marinobacter]UQG56553.1 LysR substrate-binding domain-containing protein [Marinobacter sp. M4C]UQG62254.1 LysR substrate-binding domain-containing protein [Marinobacter sp. M3C]UQG65357.1 LysR substrate-binding domain-containing protein [Marinobacter sp. M2C]UQG69636.1 LysR substrate-binding domain-containing protein [Marinobacter sp. M1C]